MLWINLHICEQVHSKKCPNSRKQLYVETEFCSYLNVWQIWLRLNAHFFLCIYLFCIWLQKLYLNILSVKLIFAANFMQNFVIHPKYRWCIYSSKNHVTFTVKERCACVKKKHCLVANVGFASSRRTPGTHRDASILQHPDVRSEISLLTLKSQVREIIIASNITGNSYN